VTHLDSTFTVKINCFIICIFTLIYSTVTALILQYFCLPASNSSSVIVVHVRLQGNEKYISPELNLNESFVIANDLKYSSSTRFESWPVYRQF